jgi:hypothetical protein
VAVPFTWWKLGANSIAMLATFGVLLLVGLATSVAYFRAHKELYPNDSGTRWQHSFLIAVVPTHTSRAKDLLARDLFAEFHPLAIAKLALPAESFESFGNWIRRELKFPLPPQRLDEAELRPVEEFLAAQNVVDRTPVKLADATQYCPRCHAQFSVEASKCEDCGGMQLRKFSD